MEKGWGGLAPLREEGSLSRYSATLTNKAIIVMTFSIPDNLIPAE